MECGKLKSELDWAASIVPGRSMLGLNLGLSQTEVMSLVESSRVASPRGDGEFLIQFKNSPVLMVKPANNGIVLLDTGSLRNEKSGYDEVFSLGWTDDGVLVHLLAVWLYGQLRTTIRGSFGVKWV